MALVFKSLAGLAVVASTSLAFSQAACSGQACEVVLIQSQRSLGKQRPLADQVVIASPTDKLAMVEDQVKVIVAARAAKNISTETDATKEALKDIYYEIEHTSLRRVFEDHNASVASLSRHRQNLVDCQNRLSTAELDQLLLDHPRLKQESDTCQARVVTLKAAMDSANTEAQKFVDALNTCHEWSGLGTSVALQKLKILAATILEQTTPQLQDLTWAADNATDDYISTKASCDHTAGLYKTTSCTLRTVVDVVISEYTMCRATQVPLLEQEFGYHSKQAERRQQDHIAYKKIQCFIGVLNATTNEDALSQLEACTSTDFGTDGLNLDEPDAVPEADTSLLLEAKQAAEVICPAPTTTTTTTTTTTSTDQAVTLHRCLFSGAPSGDAEVKEHEFTEADCGGSLPAGLCMGMLRRTVQNGRDGDWQADAPGTHGNLQAKVLWQCHDKDGSECAANPNIAVDYVCGLSPSLHKFTSCEGQTAASSLTFTSGMCSDGLPADFGATDCMAVMKRQWQSTDARGSEDFQLTWNPARMWWWRGGTPSASRSLLGADFMCGVPSGFVLTHCEATATLPAVGTNTITFTKEQCGGAYPAGECVAGLRKAQQSGEDEDWQVFLPHENGGVPKVMWFMRAHGTNSAIAAADFLCRT